MNFIINVVTGGGIFLLALIAVLEVMEQVEKARYRKAIRWWRAWCESHYGEAYRNHRSLWP